MHEIIKNVTFWGSGKLRNEKLIGAREVPSKINVKIILKIILIKTFLPEENLAHDILVQGLQFSRFTYALYRPYRNFILTKRRKMDCLKKLSTQYP